MIKMFLEHFPEILKGKIPKNKELNLYFNNYLQNINLLLLSNLDLIN